MNSILIALHPEQVANILNEEQTIIIKKTAPKCELPIEVYVYCTNDKNKYLYWDWYDPPYVTREWFVSPNPQLFLPELKLKKHKSGKVVAKFTLRKAEECVNPFFPKGTFATKTATYESLLEQSCLNSEQFDGYLGKGKRGYAWHISDLENFLGWEKELSDFGLKRAPRSWCYVEAESDGR